MNIHIDQIRVNRDGPLAEDFELACGKLNLIYGQNESGKSYLVECLIKSLFKTSGRGVRTWPLRSWDPRAQVTVSGLKETPVQFKPTSKEKIEALWQVSDKPLPDDLARLLVVKEGATWLAETGSEDDGVGMDVLRNFLSGEKLLDGVEGRISKTLQKATIDEGEIQGNQAGEIKDHNLLEADLAKLDALLEECDQKSSPGRLVVLEADQKRLLNNISTLSNAKRHKAFLLASSISKQQTALDHLPGEQEIGGLSQKIEQFSNNKKKLEANKQPAEVARLQSQIDDHQYLVQATTTYKSIAPIGPQSQQGDWSQWLLPAALLFMVVASITGLASWSIVSILTGVIAILLVVGHLWLSRQETGVDPGASAEWERLAEEYQRRFGEPLADLASLEANRDKFSQLSAGANINLKSHEKTEQELQDTSNVISTSLTRLSGEEVEAANWDSSLDSLNAQRNETNREIDKLTHSLRALGVPTDQYLQEDPEHAWDAAQFSQRQQELQNIENQIEADQEELADLKQRATRASNIDNTAGWEELLDGLRTRREEVAKNFRLLTADIIGKILVYKVVTEQRDQENDHIREGLQSTSIAEALEHFSGRYRHFHLTEDEQLEVEDSSGNQFPVSMLSTGAREQVFLALRIGFASRALGERTGFLLLDDAFQHSDWQRREGLVQQCLTLVEQGWQVFYFAMDDHLRDLFHAKGKHLGDRFTVKILQ